MCAITDTAVGPDAGFRERLGRAVACVAVGLLCGACGSSDDAPEPACREEVVGTHWVAHHWGDVAIHDIWVGVDEHGTTMVRAARDDGSVAGLNDPGRFATVPVGPGALAGISADETGRLSAIGADGTLFESTVEAFGVWSDGPRLETNSTVRALAGAGAGLLCAVGTGGLVGRFEDRAWSSGTHGTVTYDDVWASASDVWVVGEAGAAHLTGANGFEDLGPTEAPLHAVFGSSTGEVWVVGDHGTWLAWDGGSWSAISTPTDSTLRAVWGDADAGGWAGGDDGALLHVPPGGTEAVVEDLPNSSTGVHFTALAGVRTLRRAGTSPEPSIVLWATTSEGVALSREEVVSTICE